MKRTAALIFLFAIAGRADLIQLGTLSYDTFIPGDANSVGVAAFNISNLTGDFSLPPDFPVLDNLVFQSAKLTLSDGEVFNLGDIGPGFLLDQGGNPIIQVPADEAFQSAEFTATLSATSFATPEGMFTVDSDLIDISLLPSQGTDLAVDVDNTTITVSGEVATVTPEPSSWGLTLLGSAGLAWMAYRRKLGSASEDRP